MKEGSLYCTVCGEEIHIVPDFEPELEDAYQQTIKNITDDIWEKDSEKDEETDSNGHSIKTSPKRAGSLTIAAATIVFFAAIAGIIAIFCYYSVDFQTSMAKKCLNNGMYDAAVRFYERAVELDSDNVDLLVEFSEVYFRKNNKMEYEYLLRKIAASPKATQEQIESAYGKLIAIYRSRGDYSSINEFLLSSGNDNVISTYQSYVAKEPEFSVNEGFYTSIQPLKLTAFGSGKIYYTLDESEPDADSTQYTTPILLENGDYCIKAFYISENGIRSNVVTKNYHIEIEELPIPEISVISGEYIFPINIEVLDDAEDVYYTIGGGTPTKDSTLYTGPIPMPVGKSVFKFIRIHSGMSSAVEERTYQLTMNTNISPQDAEKIVLDNCLRTGKVNDYDGHFDEDGNIYRYQYEYVTNINNIDDFYVVSETLVGIQGSITKTGSYYAVNAYTGKMYPLSMDGNNYLLVGME